MASGSTHKVRLVRCPNCRNLLPEIANVPVYMCGGCGTILQAKNRKIDTGSTSSGSHETYGSETNNLDHVSEDKESSRSIHEAILPSPREFSSLDEINGRDHNKPGVSNSNQLGVVNLSIEDQNSRSDQNEPCNRNIEWPEICNEVCSSAELSHCGSEELPPIAGAHSEVEGKDESPPLPGAHSEVEVNDKISPLPRANSEEEVNDESPPLSGANSDLELNNENSPVAGANSEAEITCNRNIEWPEVCNEVCSSAELSNCGSEEMPPIAGAHSEVEGNDESPPLPGAHSEAEVNDKFSPLPRANSDLELNNENAPVAGAKSEAEFNNESNSNFISSSSTDSLVATRLTDSFMSHRPAGESISSDALLSSTNELLEQPQKSVHHGFDRVRSTDSIETTEFLSPSSEFSATLEYLSKCPTTGSSHAYDGSVSSYDGVDDQFPDRHRHSFKNAYKAMNSHVSEERLRRDKFPVNRNPELQRQARKFSSVLSNKKHYSTESSKWDQDELLEPARHGLPVRNWARLETDEYQSQVPLYRRGSPAGYGSGSPSSQFPDEFHRNPRFHSPDKPDYTEQEKMKLLRMVCELQDQINKTRYLNGTANGRVSSGHISRFYDHEASEEEIYQDLSHSRYPGRLRQGNNWSQQSNFSRIPFSGEAINSRHQVDQSCLCCHPQDWQCSAQLPPPVLRHNKGFCRVHPHHNCYNSYSSCPSSPQRCLDSEFPTWSCETKSDDQRHKDHEVKKYLREKHHLVKRHLRPTAGGAPFITCYRCLKPLQLPADFLLYKRRCHRLRCGSCSEILKFSLNNRTHIVPYTPNAPPPSEVDDFSDAIDRRSLASASHANNCLHADPVSCSDDYGLSFCKSCSTDGDPVSLTLFDDRQGNAEGRSTSNGVEQRKEFVLKQSRNKDKSPVETYESAGPSSNICRSEKVSSEIEELPPRGGSPLHRLMGYSSASDVMYGAGPSGLGSSSPNPRKVLRSRN